MVKKIAKINDECINCGMCYDVCPFAAINEAGDNNNVIDKAIVNNEHYFVNSEKCVGCGRCCSACPIKNIEIQEIN